MTTPRLRLLRRALLGGVVAVVAAVAWTFRGSQPSAASPSPTPAGGARPSPSAEARTENLVYKSFKGERQSFSLAAREMVGQEQEEVRLKGVDFTFSYVSQGKPGTGTIKSDTCLYNPVQQKAQFAGAVKMNTSDGFELRTESLIYRGDKEIARSDALVEYSRGVLSGRSQGFTYASQEGRLEMPAEVFVRTEAQGGPATEITATRAELMQQEGTMRFLQGVQVVQGGDRLQAETFEMDFGEDRTIYRARAIEKVVVNMSGGALPGSTTAPQAASGPRALSCRKLDMWFRPGGLLQEVTATQDAVLVLSPGPKDPPERRRLRSDVIQFMFDEAGKLTELRTARGTFFEAVATGKEKKEPRTLSCQRLLAKVDAASGNVSVVEFEGNIVFAQGRRKAVAQKAYYDGNNQGLYLVEAPELIDEEQGSHLSARSIDIASNGDLAAKENVRHVVRGRTRSGGLLGGEAPLQLSSRTFAYEAASGTATYKEQALLRTGRDEVRGSEIRLQDKEGVRRLTASGGVVSLLHPKGEGRQGQPMETRSADMTYDEGKKTALFRNDVTIKQGDMTTRSPEATLTLDAQGSALESLQAGSPVEVTFGQRKATGALATYAPAAGTLTIVGEKVRMKDPE
ncbi:MAG TPA: LptA/OstA family protein, partial [Vicinamibacteria bacterium]|nr:LptA/OstA family protein [Vicinamibacteria bacterium]